MTINQERFPTYKPLSPVLRTQTTYLKAYVRGFSTTAKHALVASEL